MPSLLELQDLYHEALVRETIEKTKSCGLVWTHLGGTQFQATSIDDLPSPATDITWDFFLTKTQIGNASFKYTLDVKKDSTAILSIEDGPLPNTDRNSVVKELYEIVEIIVLQLDLKRKDAIRVVQQINDCRTG